MPAALGVDLAEEVQVHRVVDGDEVVQLGNDPRRRWCSPPGRPGPPGCGRCSRRASGYRRRRRRPAGPCPASCSAPVILPALAMSTKASTYISVWTPRSFRSDWAIMAPTVLGMPPMPSWRQAPLGISVHDKLGHGPVHVGGGAAGAQLGHRRVLTLHYHVHVLDVDLAARETNAPRQILVDLYDDHFGLGQHVSDMGGHEPEVEVAVGVHGGDLEHGHVHRGGHPGRSGAAQSSAWG